MQKLVTGNRLLAEIAQVSVAVTVANLLFFAFQIIVGRGLGPEDYSLFASLFAIVLVAGALVNAIAVGVAKLIATSEASGQGPVPAVVVSSSLLQMLLLGIVILVAFGLASPLIASYLQAGSALPVIATGTVVAVSLLMPVTRGALQGTQRFAWLSVTHVVHAGTRLVFGLVALTMKLGVTGVLAATGLSSLVAMAVGLVVIRPPIKLSVKALPMTTFGKVLVPIAVGSLAMSFSTSADVVVVRHFFPASEAGGYAGAAILGRIVLLLPTGVSLVLFPKIAREWALGDSPLRLLYKGLALTTIASGSACLAFVLFPALSLSVLLGNEYAAAEQLVPLYAVAMFCFSPVIMFIHYCLATERNIYVYFFVCPYLVLQMALIYVFHASLTQVILVLLGANISLTTVSQVYILVTRGHRPHSCEQSTPAQA